MSERDEQLDLINEEIRRLRRRIEELEHSKAQIRAERADFSRCEFCQTPIAPGAALCWACSKDHYS
jgi:hypothetical protein